MKYTQLLSIELGRSCNLGKEHSACPNLSPLRYAGLDTSRRLDDSTILSVVRAMYTHHGFRGLTCWHYYNEPLLSHARMFRLMKQIRQWVPESRFLLWTNGILIPEIAKRYAEEWQLFEQVKVTEYGGHPADRGVLEKYIPQATIHHWPLDNRLNVTGLAESHAPCVRMFTEFAIDNYGNVHLCCYDWQGKASPGNVHTAPLATLISRWQSIREAISGRRMFHSAPEACQKCGTRTALNTWFDSDIAAAGDEYRLGLVAKQDKEAEMKTTAKQWPAVVFVHYRIPEQRLRDHWAWNDELYRAAGARVYVVTDRQYEVPDYAQCLVYDKPMKVFSLSATKNHGIHRAIADGCSPILSSDTDIAVASAAWFQFLLIPQHQVSIPVYRMARTNETREKEFHIDNGATGVVGMTADNWRKYHYDERCYGYGAEDGALRLALAKARVQELRDCHVYHIAHDPKADQHNIPGRGREDCWNRDDEKCPNPDNFDWNRQFVK